MSTVAQPRWFVLVTAACLLLPTLQSAAQVERSTNAPIAQVAVRSVPGLEEPLVALKSATIDSDIDIRAAVKQFETSSASSADFAYRAQSFEHYITRNPNSPWRVSILVNLGIGYYHAGYFSRAIDAWRAAWDAGKTATEPPLKALADRAVGELARMHARVGHTDELQKLFSELGDRQVSGAATEMLTGAGEGLWMFRNNPGLSFLCGPMALKNLMRTLRVDPSMVQAIDAERSGPNGYTFQQVSDLAKQLGLKHRVVFRAIGEPIPIPSIVNWRLNHYAAIVEKRNGRYRIEDPTFASGSLWVTKEAIDTEGSGYFLVPSQAANSPWREATAREAGQVFGMGFTSTSDPSGGKPEDEPMQPDGCPVGMCTVNAKLMLVSLNLNDVPIGYTPALGPPVKIKISYNQREAGQPAVFSFFNLSQKWSMNFMAWVQDDPKSAGTSVTRFVGGGSYVSYAAPYTYNSDTGEFSPERQGQAVVVRKPARGPLKSYELRMPDGSKNVYAKLDGASSFPRRVFLTSVVDPAGNAVRLDYDSSLRLASITDAVGRQTVFQYESQTYPLLITKITDPAGQSANLSYDAAGRLVAITDVVGMQSAFSYTPGGLINRLTTPYGTSKFRFGTSGTTRFLEMEDPLGLTERVEYRDEAPGVPFSDPVVPDGNNNNQYLYYRNTFYWDKSSYALPGRTYNRAKIFHWLHSPDNQTSPILESVKEPLERRVWRKYPNAPSNDLFEGSAGTPLRFARVLDDGTTASTAFTYNAVGKPLTVIDAVGRKTVYTYARNNIDLLNVQQQVSTQGRLAMISSFKYNTQHRAISYTNAAGVTTNYGYNGVGQLTSVTDTLGRVTSYGYDGLGRLTSIVNAAGMVQESRTYDSLDRLVTLTDSEGYTLTYSYDPLNRLIQTAYPDGTTSQFTYDRLDLVARKDRLGRVTTFAYDANRRLVATTDPLMRTTSFVYYGNGTLRSITDANNNTTSWDVDLQSRPIAKHYADGSTQTLAYEASTSRLLSATDPLNQTKAFGYFNDDRIKSIVYSGAINATPNVAFTYDAFFPRRVRMVDGLGTTTWAYVPVGALGALKLSRETGPYATNNTVSYTYDELYRVGGRTIDTAGESYGYDVLGRLATHSSALGSFNFGYLGQTEQMTSRAASTGLVGTQWAYENNNNDRRLKAILQGGQARSFGLTTAPESLITAMSEAIGGTTLKTWSFGYDVASRLLSATPSSGFSAGYSYDATDNLTSLSNGNGTRSATYNRLNQLVSLNGVPYSYDGAGNLLDDGLRTYAWDAEHRLIGIGYKSVPGKYTTMRYDGLGRRLAIVDASPTATTETRYLWCGSKLCQASRLERLGGSALLRLWRCISTSGQCAVLRPRSGRIST